MTFRLWHVAFLALIQFSGQLFADAMSGRVVGVTDGDTLLGFIGCQP